MADNPTAESLKLVQDIIKANQTRAAQLANRINLLKDEIANNEKLISLATSKGEKVALEVSLMEKMALLKESEIDVLKSSVELNGENAELAKEQIALEEQKLARMRKYVAITDESINGSQVFTSSLSRMAGVTGEWRNTLLGSFSAAIQTKAGVTSLLGSINLTSIGTNILGSSLLKVQEMTIMLAFATDTAISNFNKATAAMGKYDKELMNLEEDYHDAGISMEDAGKSMATMLNRTADLQNMTGAARKEIVASTAMLEKMGVSSETSAQNFNFLTKTMRMAGPEAGEVMRSFVNLGSVVGKGAAEISEDFAKMQGHISIFGQRSIEVFKNLEITSKNTGVAIDSLAASAEKFQTLEGAVGTAAKLNAVLGGPLFDGFELLQSSFEGSDVLIQKMREGFGRAGMDLNNLSPPLKKFAAEMAGFQNWNEFIAVYGDQLGAASEKEEEMQKRAEDLGMSVEELEELTKNQMTVQEDFNILMRDFAIQIRPLVTSLKDLMQGISSLNDKMGGFLPYIIIGIAVIAKLTMIMKTWQMANAAMQLTKLGGDVKNLTSQLSSLTEQSKKAADAASGAGSAAGQAGEGSKKGAKGMAQAGKSAGGAWKSILSFAVAALAVGAAIFIAAYGISLLAESINKLDTEHLNAFLQALGLMVALVLAIGLASLAGAKGLLVLAITMIAVGAGIYLATLGIVKMVEAINSLDTEHLNAFLWSLGLMVVLVIAVGLASLAGAKGLIVLGLAMLAVGAGIYLATIGITQMAEAIGSIVEIVSQNITEIAKAIGSIVQLVSQGITSILESFVEVVPFIESLTTMFNAMGNASIEGAFAVFALAGAVVALGVALLTIKTDDIVALGDIMTGLGTVASMDSKARGNFESASEMVENIASASGEIDTDGAEHIERILVLKKEILEKSSSSAVDFVAEMRELLKEDREARGGGGGGGSMMNIDLSLGGKTLKKMAVELIGSFTGS